MNAEEIVLTLREACTDDAYAPPMVTNGELTYAADLIESQQREIAELKADAANYQQVKKALSREGFSDIETMIARFKQVMVDENSISAARELEMDGLHEKLKASERMARNARNELCIKCGRYREAHNGACDGCRWKEVCL